MEGDRIAYRSTADSPILRTHTWHRRKVRARSAALAQSFLHLVDGVESTQKSCIVEIWNQFERWEESSGLIDTLRNNSADHCNLGRVQTNSLQRTRHGGSETRSSKRQQRSHVLSDAGHMLRCLKIKEFLAILTRLIEDTTKIRETMRKTQRRTEKKPLSLCTPATTENVAQSRTRDRRSR